MREQRVIKLKLDDIYLEELIGCGEKLTLKARGFRTTKAGTPERYELEIAMCRYGVKQFLAKVKEMHVRDRERINRELARIGNEISALQVAP
jgi:hypothetical protein